jgi:thioredoxin 1
MTTSSLIKTTDDRFEVDVLESDVPVLVDFWASWCAPCRIMNPILEELAGERDDLRIVKVDMDDNQRTAMRYDVMAAPTFMLFKHGQPVLKLVGTRPKRKLVEELSAVL